MEEVRLNQEENFEQMSNEAIAQFVQDNHTVFDEESNGQATRIHHLVMNYGTTIERRRFGFAIVHPIGSKKEQNGFGFAAMPTVRTAPVLWYFYVAPEFRKKGIGCSFARELMEKFATEAPMALLCYGPGRRKFFEKCGFQEESVDATGWSTMISTSVK